MQRLLLIGLILSLLAGCARLAPRTASPGTAADARFTELAEDYIRGHLAWRPGLGTSLGLHEYDGRLSDFSAPSLEAELARLKQFDRRLTGVDPKPLSPEVALDLRLLQATVKKEILNFEAVRPYWNNPMTYAGALDVNIYIKRNFAPLPARVRSVIAILNQATNVYSAARANLAGSLPRPFIETAIDVAGGSADFLAKDLVAALQELKDEALLREFTAANKAAVAEVRQFRDWLKEEKLPRAREGFALGHENYQHLLNFGELVTLPPEQLLEIGMRELKREQAIFAETARLIDPTRSPIEVFKAIQKDHPTPEGLIPDTRKNLEAIRQFVVDHHIVTLPSEVRVQVAETPQFERATSFASMDTPGPFETKATEAYYYVTPTETEWPAAQKEEWLTAFNYYTTDVVSIHEAFPGHYTQFICLNASPASRLRKILTSYAFAEGWAHYTEKMMLDEGFGRTPSTAPSRAATLRAAKYRLAQSDEALLRLCRLCVSIRMHCGGMTVDEGTRFFQENCYYEPKPARQESVRGTFDPEYLYYTLGKLQILKLREDWRQQEGAAYSLQRFHDEFLRHGAPPIRLLRESMLKNPRIWEETF